MMKLKHMSKGGKLEKDTIVANYPLDPARKGESIKSVEEFTDLVELVMVEKKFGSRESLGITLAIGELVPNAVNHCEPCMLTAKADIASKEAVVKLSWKQPTGARLEDIADARIAEVSELSKNSEAYERSLIERLKRKKAEGKLGGVGEGLLLVRHFSDKFESFYDPETHTMLAVVRVENKGRMCEA